MSSQPVLRTGDLEHDLVQLPFVADAPEPATDPVGEPLAEFARPLAHRFVANDDAAGRQRHATIRVRFCEGVPSNGIATAIGASDLGWIGPFLTCDLIGGDRFY